MADYPFVKYFKYLLFDHKRLIIPGLGKFYLDRLPAAIGADRQVIEPPSYHLRFEKDFIQQNYDSFSELKSYYPKLQESDFKNYARQVIDQLLSRGYVAIDDLGKLRMDNGEISFDKNLETQSMLTADLPILSLGSLKTFIPLSAYRLVERISVPSLWWTILLPLITVALLTAGLLMVYARKDDGPQNKPIIVDKPVETNTDTVYSEDTVKSENNEEFLDSLKALEEEISAEDVNRVMPSENAAEEVQLSLLPLFEQPLREARDAFEKLYFEFHLRQEQGNMTRLAERSGLERTHLYRKLKQLDVRLGRRGEE